MSEGLKYFTDIHWTVIGLIIFFFSFFILAYLQMRTYRNEVLKKAELLPFEGDTYEP